MEGAVGIVYHLGNRRRGGFETLPYALRDTLLRWLITPEVRGFDIIIFSHNQIAAALHYQGPFVSCLSKPLEFLVVATS